MEDFNESFKGLKDYELIDAGGEENWSAGGGIFKTSDPAIWPITETEKMGKGRCILSQRRKWRGNWQFFSKMPEEWVIKYKDLSSDSSYTIYILVFFLKSD